MLLFGCVQDSEVSHNTFVNGKEAHTTDVLQETSSYEIYM